MTVGAPQLQIKSFQDVLDQGYRVIVISSTADEEKLVNSDPNTAMHRVYLEMLKHDSFITGMQNTFNRLLGRDSLNLCKYSGSSCILRQTAKQTCLLWSSITSFATYSKRHKNY
jgi:hypothetical protein